jgi:hypothetical protein
MHIRITRSSGRLTPRDDDAGLAVGHVLIGQAGRAGVVMVVFGPLDAAAVVRQAFAWWLT